MNNLIKVHGHENFYRDPSTNAIINANPPPPKRINHQLNSIVSDINNLKDELSEIKSLLRSIIENGYNP